MELAPEDALRVNVLLASNLLAVRIDESKMILHALTDRGEAKIRLNPNCRDDSYLRQVRETLSSHVLGSPGGYPVYLKRWTRMGQARDGILESLLLLGEPEAVVAVVNAGGITDELARRAWWASQTSENARCMLRQTAVVQGQMGPELAAFLIEFLPFEEEARDQIGSVRLVLQGELISAGERMRLWEKGRHKNAYVVGFLQAQPDALPAGEAANPCWQGCCAQLGALLEQQQPLAVQLCRLLSESGQNFLAGVESVLKKPANQDVMVELMHALSSYAAGLGLPAQRLDTMDAIEQEVGRLMTTDSVEPLLQHAPDAVHHIRAMLQLSLLGEPVLDPVLSRTDAIGTVMRKKLRPLTEPMQSCIRVLQGS